MNIVVFGATGFIGKALVKNLSESGHAVAAADLRRDADWEAKLARADAIVNLAGAPIFGGRWSDSYKKLIHDSRTEGTRRIVEAMGRAKGAGRAPQVLVSASAIGYYGMDPSAEFTESDGPGKDFLAGVCRDWETAASEAESKHGIRTVLIRIGVVLGRGGGALAKMIPPFKACVGGPIGDGRQWMSWVDIEDVVGLFRHAIENVSVRGPLNATAPEPVTNAEFSQALGRALHRPAFLPTPALALYALVGGSAEILVKGQKVQPRATLASGYSFRYPKLDAALEKNCR